MAAENEETKEVVGAPTGMTAGTATGGEEAAHVARQKKELEAIESAKIASQTSTTPGPIPNPTHIFTQPSATSVNPITSSNLSDMEMVDEEDSGGAGSSPTKAA